MASGDMVYLVTVGTKVKIVQHFRRRAVPIDLTQ